MCMWRRKEELVLKNTWRSKAVEVVRLRDVWDERGREGEKWWRYSKGSKVYAGLSKTSSVQSVYVHPAIRFIFFLIISFQDSVWFMSLRKNINSVSCQDCLQEGDWWGREWKGEKVKAATVPDITFSLNLPQLVLTSSCSFFVMTNSKWLWSWNEMDIFNYWKVIITPLEIRPGPGMKCFADGRKWGVKGTEVMVSAASGSEK